ncbi:DUF485 domain-containing protein [Helicobacter cinaedi]|uniref:DUF485 domain-containing protein n=1 Tax=Helicobacter cinaedi TaxID=213 RepID=UPI000CF185A6|nr:DUF485 domain-containing protein [Helicobacter cinaedi]
MKLSEKQVKALARFGDFVSKRNKISLVLSFVIFACYYTFVVSVGLVPEILGYRLGPSSVTLGILIGISIIVLSIIATGVYTFLANTYLDKEQENILQQLEEADVIEALKNGEIGYKVEGERL